MPRDPAAPRREPLNRERVLQAAVTLAELTGVDPILLDDERCVREALTGALTDAGASVLLRCAALDPSAEVVGRAFSGAAVEMALAGYEVVWRPTISPVWTHVVPVGKVATATLQGFSKDNALIGVRAVGADGKRTPAVLPIPG